MGKTLTKKQIEESFRSFKKMPLAKESDDSPEKINKLLKGTITLEDAFNAFEVATTPIRVNSAEAFHQLIVTQNVVDMLAEKHGISGDKLEDLYSKAEDKFNADQKALQEKRKKMNEEFVKKLKKTK